MFNLFLTETPEATASAGNSWWIYVVLIVMVVLMLVLPTITNKRRMKEYNQMLDQLRVGDKVRTIGGIIGRVTKISTKGEVKSFTLETGARGSKTIMEFDMAALGTVLESTYVPPVTEEKKEEKKTKLKEEAKEEVKVEEPKAEETEAKPVEEKAEEPAPVVEEKVEEPKAEEAKPTKKTTKKSKK